MHYNHAQQVGVNIAKEIAEEYTRMQIAIGDVSIYIVQINTYALCMYIHTYIYIYIL